MEIKACNICGVLFESTFESEEKDKKGICPYCLDLKDCIIEEVKESLKEENEKWLKKKSQKFKEDILIETTKTIESMVIERTNEALKWVDKILKK